jgi:hypothetical protein
MSNGRWAEAVVLLFCFFFLDVITAAIERRINRLAGIEVSRIQMKVT